MEKTILDLGSTAFIAEEMVCRRADVEPTHEEIEKSVSEMGIENDLYSNVLFYNPDEKLICAANIIPTEAMKGKLGKDMIGKALSSMPGSRVLYVNEEKPERGVEKVSIICADEKVRKIIEDVLGKIGLSEGIFEGVGLTSLKIDLHRYRLLKHALYIHSLRFRHIISSQLLPAPDKPDDLELVITATPAPQRAVVRIEGQEEEGEVARHIGELLASEFKNDPGFAVALYFGELEAQKKLQEVFAEDRVMRRMGYSYDLQNVGDELKDGAIVLDFGRWAAATELLLPPSGEYEKYLPLLSKEERAKEMRDIGEMQGIFKPPYNMASITYGIKKIRKRFGNQFIAFGLPRIYDDALLLPIETKVLNPTCVELVGDYPQGDKEKILSIIGTAPEGGWKSEDIDIKKRLIEVREFYENKAVLADKVKSVDYKVNQETGRLEVIVDLARWDGDIAIIDVVSEEEIEEVRQKYRALVMRKKALRREEMEGIVNKLAEEEISRRKEQRKAEIKEILKPLEGKFINDDDIDGVKAKLSRGVRRGVVAEPVIATDHKTGKTNVVFVTAPQKREGYGSGGFGVSSFGMMIDVEVGLENDGKGNSGGISLRIIPNYSAMGGWSVSTPTGPNSRVSLSVYAYRVEYGDSYVQRAGPDVTYTHFFLNDKITISGGSGIELVDHSGRDGYGKTPSLLATPHASICYGDDSVNACVRAVLNAGAANYGQVSSTVQYRIPLTDHGPTESIYFPPEFVLTATAGAQMGRVPYLEQSTQFNIGVPFSASLFADKIQFGRYYAGISAEIVQRFGPMSAAKPFVASIYTIGNRAGASFGMGIEVFIIGLYLGHSYFDLADLTNSGLGVSIMPARPIGLPRSIRRLIDRLFFNDVIGGEIREVGYGR